MREIGSLPGSADPRILGDYLLSLGITSRVVKSREGWTFWVHDEDKLARAKEALGFYVANPDAPVFESAVRIAKELREEERAKDRAYRRNFREFNATSPRSNFLRTPITFLSILVCVGLYFAGAISAPTRVAIWNYLGFYPLDVLRNPSDLQAGLAAIDRGQFWRLISPMILHVNLVHLIFNMWATSVLSSVIETTRGSRTLVGLILMSAVVSNLGQHLYNTNIEEALRGWGGYSGVLYAMFGYLWMRSRLVPESGLMISPQAVRTMLFWLLLGFTGIIPMANGAHVAGLLVGMLLGIVGV